MLLGPWLVFYTSVYSVTKMYNSGKSDRFWFQIYQFCRERNSLQIYAGKRTFSYLFHCANGTIQEALCIIGVDMGVDEPIFLAWSTYLNTIPNVVCYALSNDIINSNSGQILQEKISFYRFFFSKFLVWTQKTPFLDLQQIGSYS